VANIRPEPGSRAVTLSTHPRGGRSIVWFARQRQGIKGIAVNVTAIHGK